MVSVGAGGGRAGNGPLVLWATAAQTETVDVKYRGPVDLKKFECQEISRSSFIQRVCYDKAQSYMIISLRGTYYHYCELHALSKSPRAVSGRYEQAVEDRNGNIYSRT